MFVFFFFFKQKTAYEMRISDWSSDVCSSDLYKMTVFDLSRWRNTAKPAGALGPDGIVIPNSIIQRPPTAELRENQTDQDSLPPYEQLDAILEMLIEKEMPVRDIVAAGQPDDVRSEEHTSELQSLMRISYAVFCLKKKTKNNIELYSSDYCNLH